MRLLDLLRVAARALVRHPARSALLLLAMTIGVAAVVILTSLGDAARRYVTGEFATLGTHLIIVTPGRTETAGRGPNMFAGETPRDLTLGDAAALRRSTLLQEIAPVIMGEAVAAWGGLEREVPVLGTTAELIDVRGWKMAQGRFLPPGDPERDPGVCVIGAEVRKELFGPRRALGEWLEIGDRRCRVTGILADEGRSIGLDVEKLVVLPVAAAQALFDTHSLFQILINAKSHDVMPPASEEIRKILRERHQGEEDVTVVTQDALLATFDRILRALTWTVGGIAAISLLVAGILIMNVMLVSVSQRTAEIGLLKALGAPRGEILRLFLVEATGLSLAGAAAGLVLAVLAEIAIVRIYPVLPMAMPLWAVVAALGTALVVGLVFGVLPARRAADLDPVAALSHH